METSLQQKQVLQKQLLEKQRLTYLEHLGIDNYISTYQLPYAATSELLPDELLVEPTAFSTADVSPNTMVESTHGDLKEISTPDLSPNITDAHQDTASPVLESLLEEKVVEALQQSDQSSASDKEESEDSTASENIQKTSESIRFALSIWRIQDEILVIDSRQPGAALPTEKLLQNILRSIHLPLAQLTSSELLRWPLFTDDHHNANEEQEARAMVQAYISAQLSNTPVKHMLLLGKDAMRFSLSIDQPVATFYETHQGTLLQQTEWSANVLIAPSLVDMLLEPLQKRITWQALQSILIKE